MRDKNINCNLCRMVYYSTAIKGGTYKNGYCRKYQCLPDEKLKQKCSNAGGGYENTIKHIFKKILNKIYTVITNYYFKRNED